jgi:hypothetical protein
MTGFSLISVNSAALCLQSDIHLLLIERINNHTGAKMFRSFLLVIFLITLSKPAYAYIDVAIGSLILQGLVAGMVSIAVIWRGWIDKVKSFFGKGDAELSAMSDTASEE